MAKKKDQDGVYTRADRPGYWISWIDANGVRRRRKTSAQTVADAKKIRAARMARAEKMKVLGVAEADTTTTFKATTDRYLAYQRPRISPQSYERTESIITNHLLPFFKKNIADIRPQDIERYITKRMSVVSAGTTIKELNIIKHLCRLAVRWELIPTDPSANVERPPTPPDRVRYLHPDELIQVLKCCPEWLKPIAILAVSTGMRRGEILGLRWRDVDFQNRQIFLGMTKNGKSRVVALNKIALVALQMLDPKPGAIGKLFPDVRPDYVTGAFKRACEYAKVPDAHLHDLRHTYASWLKMAGEDVHTVAILLGHKDLRMTTRYAHLNSSYLSNAAGKLENVFPALLSHQGVTAEAAPETEDV